MGYRVKILPDRCSRTKNEFPRHRGLETGILKQINEMLEE